jgi:hypothetical protein
MPLVLNPPCRRLPPPREKEPPASRGTEAAWRSPSPGACSMLLLLAADLVSEGTGLRRLSSCASIRVALRSMSEGFGSTPVLGGGDWGGIPLVVLRRRRWGGIPLVVLRRRRRPRLRRCGGNWLYPPLFVRLCSHTLFFVCLTYKPPSWFASSTISPFCMFKH